MINAKIEEKYPTLKWDKIWKNLNSKFIETYQRGFLYRYINETWPTNERLHVLNIKPDASCSKCGEIETQLHILYFCKCIKHVTEWFKEILLKQSKMSDNMLKMLMFDIEGRNKRETNTSVILTADYIQGMWICRREDIEPGKIVNFIRNKMKSTKYILSKIHDMKSLFTNEYISN